MTKSPGSGSGETAALFASREGRRAFVLDEREVVRFLRTTVEQEGGQSAFARRHGVERARLNQILKGKRGVTKAVMKALGLRKIYTPE